MSWSMQLGELSLYRYSRSTFSIFFQNDKRKCFHKKVTLTGSRHFRQFEITVTVSFHLAISHHCRSCFYQRSLWLSLFEGTRLFTLLHFTRH